MALYVIWRQDHDDSCFFNCFSNCYYTQTFSFSLGADTERETGRYGRKARLSDRNVHIRLEASDLTNVLNRLVNPDYSLGYVFEGETRNADDELANSVLEACGLFSEGYRYPLDHYTARDGYLYVKAFNTRHALHQLAKWAKYIGNPPQLAHLQIAVGQDWEQA